MRTVNLTVSVNVENEMPQDEIIRLVQRLIDIGLEDAANTPDDWDDPDIPLLDVLSEIVVK